MQLYRCVLSFQSWSALCKYVFFILFFLFVCYKSNCFIIFMSILNIDIFCMFMLIIYVNKLNAYIIFNCIVSVISICDFQIQYLPPPHHAVQFALPIISLLSFFVNNVIIICSFQTYTQDNRENLFSLLSDIYFQRSPCINPHSNFICNSCVRDCNGSRNPKQIQGYLYS